MAEARKPRGAARETVLRVLTGAGRPVRAGELQDLVRLAGLEVAPSLVFRAVRELVARGAIRKILVGPAYVLGDGERMASLYCPQCGALTEIACDPVFAALDQRAAAAGFAVSRHIVEVAGICRSCAGRPR